MCSSQFSILNLHFFSPLETLHFCCRYAKRSLFVPKFKIHFYLLVNVFNTRALGIKFWIKSALEFKLQVLPQCQLNANGFGKCCMFKCLSRHIGLAPIFNKSRLRKILPRQNNEKLKLYIYHTWQHLEELISATAHSPCVSMVIVKTSIQGKRPI